MAGVRDFLNGACAEDFAVHILGRVLRGVNKNAGRKRDEFEAAARTDPSARGVEVLASIVVRGSVTISMDFELSDDYGACGALVRGLCGSSGFGRAVS